MTYEGMVLSFAYGIWHAQITRMRAVCTVRSTAEVEAGPVFHFRTACVTLAVKKGALCLKLGTMRRQATIWNSATSG